ncbi:DUF1989 domain-containing protein [Marinobacterium rhizophilum]|uniref:Urea carboxylase-associated family protein n=1 Tax=Marinobacterium rhizophilum TaxID=420402 RepID=A0ABY5HN50_9GAMM|nr:urea carboxylase-associated family protein [Marinobacterium rhizophilum]UTW13364.1 urea carboxylase-associated family protein [Marinobacterium rhizophilum]
MNSLNSIQAENRVRLAARSGVAIRLARGQVIKVINTYGKQVVDTWAFNPADMGEAMSMEHSRAWWLKVNPQAGDMLITNRRRPILSIVTDTTPGVHDTLIAACDPVRYQQLGVTGHHDSCAENLASALEALGLSTIDTPSPLNLFMNVPVAVNGSLEFSAPLSDPGQYVTLRAEMELVVVLSACPQDVTAVNGMAPTDVHYIIE